MKDSETSILFWRALLRELDSIVDDTMIATHNELRWESQGSTRRESRESFIRNIACCLCGKWGDDMPTHHQEVVRDLAHYGFTNFEIIELCEIRDQLRRRYNI